MVLIPAKSEEGIKEKRSIKERSKKREKRRRKPDEETAWERESDITRGCVRT